MRQPRTKKERAEAQRNGLILFFLRSMAVVASDPELEAGRLHCTPREQACRVELLRKEIHLRLDSRYGAELLEIALDRALADPTEIQDTLDETLRVLPSCSEKPQ